MMASRLPAEPVGARAAPCAVTTAEMAALRGDNQLAGAVRAFASSLIALYDGNLLLNTVLGDRGRVLVGLFVLYLDAHPFPGTNERGATLSAVQRLCRQGRLCSAGRAASILAAMRFGGYLESRPDPEDHRRRILVPTRRLIAAHHARLVSQLKAMIPVFPAAAPARALLEDSAYRVAFLGHLGAAFLAGFRVLDHAPALATVAESTAGLLILSSVALQDMHGPGDPVPISISSLSRRFCVSRAHIRNVLALAEAEGLLRHQPGSDVVVVLPPLPEALMQFYGALFVLFSHCAGRALLDRRSTQ